MALRRRLAASSTPLWGATFSQLQQQRTTTTAWCHRAARWTNCHQRRAYASEPKPAASTPEHSPRQGGLLRVMDQPLVVHTRAAPRGLADGGVVFVHHMEVPPHAPPVRTPLGRLSPEEVAELRALRAEDPTYWSQRRLAERFGVQPLLVARVAGPVSAERLAHLEEERQLQRLRQVFANTPFERAAAGERQRAGKSGGGGGTRQEADQARSNRAKFRREVEQAGSLKAILKQHNVVPKRPRQGMRPPPLQKVAEEVSFDPAEFQPGVVGPAVDFEKATRRLDIRSPSAEEREQIRKALDDTATTVDAEDATKAVEQEIKALKERSKKQRALRRNSSA